jgi:hypothetical protein
MVVACQGSGPDVTTTHTFLGEPGEACSFHDVKHESSGQVFLLKQQYTNCHYILAPAAIPNPFSFK